MERYPGLLPNSLGTKSSIAVLTYRSYRSNKPTWSYCRWVAPGSRSAAAGGCLWVTQRGAVWGQPQLGGVSTELPRNTLQVGGSQPAWIRHCHKTTDVSLVEGEGFITVHNTSWPPVQGLFR